MNRSTLATGTDQVSVRVIEAVADASGTDALDLHPPLYSAIDPTALDRLCTGKESVSVRFEYLGHTVTVSGEGTVAVDGRVYD
ncbi:HalOD1 output domain-containing protein [Halosolutus gelatinilyticus]|uniref:HalOD1 output domain-containing protein n=1 Tax=Halosolutus gelatinilyticus TaxID=2931975 RepID=UPI001FF6D720|nr:HalOD1 output domain-containing protein [Halosolutus gelatinilyticus]